MVWPLSNNETLEVGDPNQFFYARLSNVSMSIYNRNKPWLKANCFVKFWRLSIMLWYTVLYISGDRKGKSNSSFIVVLHGRM